MVTPCINNIEHFFYYQLTHTTLKNVELLKHSKISKNAPTCFSLQGNHLQGAKISTWLKVTRLVNSRYVKDVSVHIVVHIVTVIKDICGICKWIVGNHYLYTCVTDTTYWSTSNRPMKITHFLSWRPYYVTLYNLLDTLYPHTVHDTHVLQSKSYIYTSFVQFAFTRLNFYLHIPHISFITVTTRSHNTDTSFTYLLLTKRVTFSKVLILAPWRWFPCKPKHVGAFLLILECFNNSTFFNVVCVSW